MLAGLVGGHRTGKTTLAREYAKKNKIEFVETSVSAIMRDLGVDPGQPMAFATRLDVQEAVLARADALFERYVCAETITDRTPIDFIAYLMADLHGQPEVGEAEETRIKRYVDACYDMLNRRFGVIMLVQPGIPLVYEPGKAALSPSYIEHLNTLMLGLMADGRCQISRYHLGRHILDIKQRLAALEEACARERAMAAASMNEVRQLGYVLH